MDRPTDVFQLRDFLTARPTVAVIRSGEVGATRMTFRGYMDWGFAFDDGRGGPFMHVPIDEDYRLDEAGFTVGGTVRFDYAEAAR